jgi:Holliday junction DNA helicase RuvA
MYEYIEGKVEEVTPAYVIINNHDVGYFINISLSTFPALTKEAIVRLYVHQVVREDAHLLFGFATKTEREIFRQLITVSGIGANTARMMLSSMSPTEIQEAILNENLNSLKSIKGIGAKSAQRLIVELKDKLSKEVSGEDFLIPKDNTIRDEALSALVALGFGKPAIEKVIDRILSDNQDINVEDLIKQALKKL